MTPLKKFVITLGRLLGPQHLPPHPPGRVPCLRSGRGLHLSGYILDYRQRTGTQLGTKPDLETIFSYRFRMARGRRRDLKPGR